MKNYLIFNGVNTLTDLNLHIDELPIIGSFEESKDLIEVTGRDGFFPHFLKIQIKGTDNTIGNPSGNHRSSSDPF